jgi:hypothetical protein
VTVTFQNQMAGWDWPVLTLYENKLTGGTSPTVTRSTTTSGVGANPASIANVFTQTGADTTTRVRSTTELANTTTFRAFVRVTDSSGLTGAWDYSQFSTAYTAFSVPTVTVGSQGGLAGNRISISATTGTGLPVAARFAVQYQDPGSSVWYNVRNGDALVPDGSGKASVVDNEAPFGVARTYRAVTYVYDSTADLWQQSAWSGSVSAALTPQTMWALTNPFDSNQGLVARVQSFETVASVVVGKFFAAGRADPIVMSDGPPKYPGIELNLWSLSSTERAELEALCNADTVLLLRNFYGECFYIRLDNEFRRTYLRSSPLRSESTPLRDAKSIRVTTQAVKRPVAGPTSGPLVEV